MLLTLTSHRNGLSVPIEIRSHLGATLAAGLAHEARLEIRQQMSPGPAFNFVSWILSCAIRNICSQGGEYAMVKPKLISAALLFVVADSMTNGASAITVELAKKCQALTNKAFPPRVIGNPAAGSAKGSGKDERAYFSKCVKNDGKVDDAGSKEAK
jgi:hypothetical protein